MVESEIIYINIILAGLVFGLIIVSPLIYNIILKAIKGKKDDPE